MSFASPSACVQTLYKDVRLFASATSATAVAKQICEGGLDLPTYTKVRNQQPGSKLTQVHFDTAVQAGTAAHSPSACAGELKRDLMLFAPSASVAEQIASSTCTATFDLEAYRVVRSKEPGLRLSQVGFDAAVRAGNEGAVQAAPTPRPAPAPAAFDCVGTLQPYLAKQYGASYALDSASKTCRTPFDSDIFLFAMPYYLQQFGGGFAVEQSVKLARTPGLRERLPLVAWVTEQYTSVWSGEFSVKQAVKITEGRGAVDQACLKNAFSIHSKQFGADFAMKKAFENCR
jgi:hypothetical protein